MITAAAAAGLPVAPAGASEPTIRVLLVDGVGHVEIDGRVRRRPQHFGGAGPHDVDGRRVRGAVEVIRSRSGLRVVNELPLEDYVAGTVLGEVPMEFGDAVLRAQAIAIRTYALHRRAGARGRDYDLEAGTRGQVYLGLAGETAAVRDAVARTRGQVLTWDGAPILAAFHSAAGGRTASAEEVWGRPVPYLVSVGVDNEGDSPDTYWRAPVSHAELAGVLAEVGRPVGRVREVSVRGRSASGRVVALRVRGTRGEVEISGETLRRALGPSRIRSTLFEVRRGEDGSVFVGSGFGHGVGMSQWGARALARAGADHRQILARFYPGARLERISERTSIGWTASETALAGASP